jgi:hypothetical protein
MLVGLDRFPVMFPVLENAAPPVKTSDVGADQLKIVPEGTIPFAPGAPTAGVTVKTTPSQETAVMAFT